MSGVNEDNSPGNQWEYSAAGANPFYIATHTSTTMQAFTQQSPENLAPTHDKLHSGNPIYIPPEHVFSFACTDTSLNGTAIVNIITAELDW